MRVGMSSPSLANGVSMTSPISDEAGDTPTSLPRLIAESDRHSRDGFERSDTRFAAKWVPGTTSSLESNTMLASCRRPPRPPQGLRAAKSAPELGAWEVLIASQVAALTITPSIRPSSLSSPNLG
jgi:hypothetical protein